MMQKIALAMQAEEERRWADPELAHELTPEARAALEARAKLPPSCYGSQAALWNLLCYCDDARFAVSGPARAMRLLKIFYGVVGPDGLRLPLSRADKQQTGWAVEWLGGCLSSAAGVMWVPPEKKCRAAAGISTMLAGEMRVGEYRKHVGFLVSLLFMMGDDKRLLHHIFRPVKPGEEIDRGPDTLVYVDECMEPVLRRWRALVMDVPGAPMLSAIAPMPPPAVSLRHRVRTDAALKGCERPGVGGWMYGRNFAVAIEDVPGMELLDIPHLEAIAAGLGILTFEPILADARHIVLETDALATATTLSARAKSTSMQIILDMLLEANEYTRLAPRLEIVHCWGAGNPLADAASRSYAGTMSALSAALGMPVLRVPLSPAADAFLHRVLDRLVKSLGRKPMEGSAARPNPPTPPYGGESSEVIQYAGAAGDGSDSNDYDMPPPPAPHELGAGVAAVAPEAAGGGGAPPRRLTARCGYADHDSCLFNKRPVDLFRRSPVKRSSPRKRDVALAGMQSPDHDIEPPHPPGAGGAAASAAAAAAAATAEATAPSATPAAAAGAASHKRNRVLFAAASPMADTPDAPDLAPPPAPPTPTGEAPAPPHARRVTNLDKLRAARVGRADELFKSLRLDSSENSLDCLSDERLAWLCDAAAVGHEEEMPYSSRVQRASNWKHWSAYVAWLSPDLSPWRPDINSLDGVGVQRECTIWAGALGWIFARMKPAPRRYLPPGPPHYGRPKPPMPQSALAVLRGVRAEHIARGVTPPPMKLATRRCHELMLKYKREHGADSLNVQRKAPLTHLIITSMLAVPNDDMVLAKGKTWSWLGAYGCSTRTLIHVLSQTGFRKAEVTTDHGAWTQADLSFRNLKWKIGGETVLYPNAAQLLTLRPGDFAVLMPPPSKADQFGMRWGCAHAPRGPAYHTCDARLGPQHSCIARLTCPARHTCRARSAYSRPTDLRTCTHAARSHRSGTPRRAQEQPDLVALRPLRGDQRGAHARAVGAEGRRAAGPAPLHAALLRGGRRRHAAPRRRAGRRLPPAARRRRRPRAGEAVLGALVPLVPLQLAHGGGLHGRADPGGGAVGVRGRAENLQGHQPRGLR